MSRISDLFEAIEVSGSTARMDDAIDIVDSLFCDLKEKHPELYKSALQELEGVAYAIDKEQAIQIVREMRPKGERFSMESVKKFLSEKGITEKCRYYYLVMNMYANDAYQVAQKYGQDNTEFYFELAKSFINDEDANPLKVEMYFRKS